MLSVSLALAEPVFNPSPAVWNHEAWRAGLHSRSVDASDPAAVFRAVFRQLPDHVQVGPTENYVYWRMAVDGRELHGNIRLAVEGLPRGEISFAYGEPTEFLDDAERSDRLAVARTFSEADKVRVEADDAFTVSVGHEEKTVVFHLNRLAQELPAGFPLAASEKFLQRTEDESGLRFFLLFNEMENYFFWGLDESTPVPEHFRALAPDVVGGRRTGFVFWIQESLGGRKVLASVRSASLQRNDPYDGPFDQLADTFVQGDGLRPYFERAMPWLRGRVDAWGHITGDASPRRVALTTHGTHNHPAEALPLIDNARRQPDPVGHLSRGRIHPPPITSPPADPALPQQAR